jgi:hypothetical protein
MDEIMPILILVTMLLLSVFGSVAIVEDITDKPEKEVIRLCETNGYWQYKQTRVLCSIENQGARK